MSTTTKVAEDIMLGGKHSTKLEYIGGGWGGGPRERWQKEAKNRR